MIGLTLTASLVSARRSQLTKPLDPVTAASSTEVPPSTWEENTGLLSSLVPSLDGRADPAVSPTTLSAVPSPVVYNKSRGPLKLGPAPLPEGLMDETKRVLREEPDPDTVMTDGLNGSDGAQPARRRNLTSLSGESTLVNPTTGDLLPRPIIFRSIDVKREVEKVQDVRKRIRLQPPTLTAADYEMDRKDLFAKSGSLPSVCAYTFHDAPDG